MTTVVPFGSLAGDINVEHEACQNAYRGALAHAVRAGELLLRAKDGLPHGEFRSWCENHLACSERTVQVYMQLANAPELANPQSSADLSIAGALKQVSKPRKQSSGNVIDLLRSERDPGADNVVRLPVEHERAHAAAASVDPWTVQQQRKRHKAITYLEACRDSLDGATAPGLSEYAIGELLGHAAVSARHAAGILDELAFTFGR